MQRLPRRGREPPLALVGVTLSSKFFGRSCTNVTLLEKVLRPLVLFITFSSASALCLHKESEQRNAHTSKHKSDVCRMRTVIGALLLTGVAGLAPTQQHKKLKLAAAPLLPALLLPSAAVAAADSYEYGSA